MAFTVFGATTHRYQRQAPVGPDALARWEQRQGVTLPDEYRRVVLQIGNGGPSPGYRLMPLDPTEDVETLAHSPRSPTLARDAGTSPAWR